MYRSSFQQEQNVKAVEGILEAVLKCSLLKNIMQMAAPLCLYIKL
jgi:hypothetical protein